jgi:3-oxoacyl-[acyl-carrier-protein] synthase-3
MALPIQLAGTGSYVPRERLTNDHFAAYLETNDEWIVTRTGIRERRRAAPEELTSTMGANAARAAIADAGIEAGDIDLIICATATGDEPLPATAARIQHAIGANGCSAFDVSAACAGFLHAGVVASSMVSAGLHRCALIIGAEMLTRFADSQDRGTVILFGDAAGAAILRPTTEDAGSVLFCKLGCDGARAEDIWIPAGGSRLPTSTTTVDERLHFIRMRGRDVYKFAVQKMQEMIDEALAATGLSIDDVRMIIPHQSNLRIIESVREKMNIPPEKVAVNIERYGNTSAASVIVALDEARRAGALRSGDRVLLLAIGAGLAWGTMLLRL